MLENVTSSGDATRRPPVDRHEPDRRHSMVLDADETTESAVRHSLFLVLERYGVVLAWIVVLAVFGFLRPATFLTAGDFSSMAGSQSVLVILSLGLLVPLRTGEFDLSIAGVLLFSAMLVAVLNGERHWPIVPAVFLAVVASTAVGWLNGLIVTVLNVESIVVTLASGTILGGVVYWISGFNTVSGISTGLSQAVYGDTFLGISLSFYYAVAVACTLWIVFEHTALGARLLFVGQSRRVAHFSGLRVRRLRWGSLCASALLAGIAGVVFAGTSGSVDPSSGTSFLLAAFAAAFLGATCIIPGRFNSWGTIISVYFLTTGITGLTIVGMQSYVQDLFYGGALLAAVSVARVGSFRRGRRGKSSVESGILGSGA